ncbi:MAG: DUF6850 family outer membrane beta-barrel protein [Bacteroidales bacterium]
MEMRKIKYLIGAFTTILALLLTLSVAAQNLREVRSPLEIEYMKANSLWFQTGNSAGLPFDNLAKFSQLQATYNITNGDYKFVQQGDKENTLGVVAEGGQQLGKGYGWGSFSYNNITVRDSRFNTAMLNPFRGVPYYPVDPNISDWKRQDYNLGMKVASRPLIDNLKHKLILGLGATYIAETGAKQIDPRSEVYNYSINVKPSIAYSICSHIIGLNFEYENMYQETRKHTNSDNQSNQNVYVLRGLGYNYGSVIGGLQSLGGFHYQSHKVGAEAQYAYDFIPVRVIVSGGGSLRGESVVRDISKPRKEGSIKELILYANSTLLWGESNLNRIVASYNRSDIDGIEFVQVLDTQYEVQQWVDLYSSIRSNYRQDDIALSYDYYRGKSASYKWMGSVAANYRKSDDIYYLPLSNREVTNLYGTVAAKANLVQSTKGYFNLGVDFTYKHNLSGEYNYNGPDPTSPVIQELFIPDLEYQKNSYYKVGASVALYSLLGKRIGGQLSANIDYYKPVDLSTHRLFSTFGLTFTF